MVAKRICQWIGNWWWKVFDLSNWRKICLLKSKEHWERRGGVWFWTWWACNVYQAARWRCWVGSWWLEFRGEVWSECIIWGIIRMWRVFKPMTWRWSPREAAWTLSLTYLEVKAEGKPAIWTETESMRWEETRGRCCPENNTNRMPLGARFIKGPHAPHGPIGKLKMNHCP